jgi:hypothetical protein
MEPNNDEFTKRDGIILITRYLNQRIYQGLNVISFNSFQLVPTLQRDYNGTGCKVYI